MSNSLTQIECENVAPVTCSLAVDSLTDRWAVSIVDLDEYCIDLGILGSFDQLEHILVGRNASSLLVVLDDKDTADHTKRQVNRLVEKLPGPVVVDFLSDRGKLMTQSTSSREIRDDLRKLVDRESSLHCVANLLDAKEMRLALRALLNAEELVMMRDNKSVEFTFNAICFSDSMFLDTAAIEALQILSRTGPRSRVAASAQVSIRSVEDLFANHLRTSMGKRCLKQWLVYPSRNVDEINNRLNLLTVFHKSDTIRRVFSVQLLRKIHDIRAIALLFRKHHFGSKQPRLNLTQLMNLYSSILEATTMLATVRDIASDVKGWIECGPDEADAISRSLEVAASRLEAPLGPLSKFVELIDHAVDVKKWNTVTRSSHDITQFISPHISEELQQLFEEKKRCWAKMEHYVNKMGSLIDSNKRTTDSLKILSDDREGYIIRSTKAAHSQVLEIVKKSELTFSRLNKNDFLFSTEKFDAIKFEYEIIRTKSEDQTRFVMDTLIKTASTYHKPVERLANVIAFFDVVCAFSAVTSISPYPWCMPVLTDNGTILSLKDARHALLCERDFGAKDDANKLSIVANDAFMEQDRKRFTLITGPNMGGKSTYIRTVALCAVLAQAGCYVPCTEAHLPLFSKVLCRVGASDAIMSGSSTFMVEMLEASSICRLADSSSLILVDELGRGTSTSDGFGLAYAIAEHLALAGCFSFFATHFSEMSHLLDDENSGPHVQALHLTTSVSAEGVPSDGIRFHYRVEEGVCGKSYGIEVAKMAGLPQEVVSEAEKVINAIER
eukprot:GHVH01014759.1.p1 GENE.GHVH01014759.1~~GHVH01014759.1.p1  ORF type:complete len:782 (+),score=114.57 GHVH01014759.1:3184-5529(+)